MEEFPNNYPLSTPQTKSPPAVHLGGFFYGECNELRSESRQFQRGV